MVRNQAGLPLWGRSPYGSGLSIKPSGDCTLQSSHGEGPQNFYLNINKRVGFTLRGSEPLDVRDQLYLRV